MKRFLTGILLIILFLPFINSFMPPDHRYINNELMATYKGNSDFYNICKQYPDLCYVGNILTDISVVYYYTQGGLKYESTHFPNFCTEGMDRATTQQEKACAIGMCLHHTQDVVSHTQMVPYAIKHLGIPNSIIHVFAEQHMSNIILSEHPEIRGELNINRESWKTCSNLVKKVLENNENWKSDFDTGKIDTLINDFIIEVEKSINPNAKTSYDLAFENKVSFFGKFSLMPLPFLIT